MSFSIHTKTEGFKQARKVWRRLERADVDRRPLADAMGQTLVQSAVERLSKTNTGPDGTPWAQSSRAKHDGGKTQFQSGMAGLAGSLLHDPDHDGVDYGSPLVYAAQRQFGGTIEAKPGGFLVFDTIDDETGESIKIFAKKVEQPARPYLGVSEEDATELGALAVEYYGDAAGLVQ